MYSAKGFFFGSSWGGGGGGEGAGIFCLQILPVTTVHLFLGGSVVVDLTNDSGFHDSNVVDLTSESPADSSIDSSPVIVV